MSTFNNSPNLSLPIPVVGVAPSPEWADLINACLTIVDGHTHAPGSGIPITPDALNINAALDIKSNDIININSLELVSHPTPLSSIDYLTTVYASDGDLFFNDINGNQIQITSGGAVAGTPGSIGGLVAPASVSYVSISQSFEFISSGTTRAAVDVSELWLRGNGTNKMSLKAPLPLAGDTDVTMPAAPLSSKILTMDSAGVITAAIDVDNSSIALASNNIQVKDGGVTISKMAPMVNAGATAGLGQVAVSPSSDYFSYAPGGEVTVLSVTITTSGRPVMLTLMPSANSSSFRSFIEANVNAGGTADVNLRFYRGSTPLAFSCLRADWDSDGSADFISIPPSMHYLDFPAAGTHTYTFRVENNTSNDVYVYFTQLVAYEI